MAKGRRVPLELLREGRLEEAVAAYRDLWKKDPKEQAVAEGRINSLGYTFLRKRSPTRRSSSSNSTSSASRIPGMPMTASARAYAALGKTDLAIKSYERSLDLNPGSAGGRTMLDKLKKK